MLRLNNDRIELVVTKAVHVILDFIPRLVLDIRTLFIGLMEIKLYETRITISLPQRNTDIYNQQKD